MYVFKYLFSNSTVCLQISCGLIVASFELVFLDLVVVATLALMSLERGTGGGCWVGSWSQCVIHEELNNRGREDGGTMELARMHS